MPAKATKSVAKRRTGVFDEVKGLIEGDRQEAYGDVDESFGRIAALWEQVLGYEVTPEQVAVCLLQLKVARYVASEGRDSVVDMVGYAGLLAKLHGWEP
jgi:hypothetical protein